MITSFFFSGSEPGIETSHTPRRPGSCFRPASAAPRSTSCNGMSACGPGRHSAGSDDTCSDATCSSGDAGPRRTSLAGTNQTNEGTSDWPSSPDEEPAHYAGSRVATVTDLRRLRPERSAVNAGLIHSPIGVAWHFEEPHPEWAELVCVPASGLASPSTSRS